MESDVYFNCPNCTHTIMTDAKLIGKSVQCPDCETEVNVPLVKEGRNPRLRSAKKTRRGGEVPPKHLEGMIKRAEVVQKGLISLERRQVLQNRKVEHLTKNLALATDQIQLIEKGIENFQRTESPEPVRVLDVPQVQEKVVEPAASVLPDRLAKVCTVLTILSAIAVGAWILLPS